MNLNVSKSKETYLYYVLVSSLRLTSEHLSIIDTRIHIHAHIRYEGLYVWIDMYVSMRFGASVSSWKKSHSM